MTIAENNMNTYSSDNELEFRSRLDHAIITKITATITRHTI